MTRCLLSTIFLCLAMLAGAAQAAFPEKAITMIVPISAGGGLDTVARALVPPLEKELGVKVIIKNIAGAGGTLGATDLSLSDPDGYTVGYLAMGPLSLQPQIRKLPYTIDSFKPVASVHNTPYVFMVRGDSPMNTLEDARKFLLEKNGEAAFGSPGAGGLTHIAALALFDAMGVQAKHVPDRSAAESLKSLAGDFTQFYADTMTVLTAYDVKALGIFAAQRHPKIPDVPTMKELGYDFEFSSWGGILAPRGTPDEVVATLERAVRAAVNSPEFKAASQKNGFDVADMSGKDFAGFIAGRMVLDKRLIVKFGLQQ